MIDKSLINKVLRRVMAQEDEPFEEKTPEKGQAPAVQRWRYYFYDANPGNSIPFTDLTEVLRANNPGRDVIIKKLEGGNTAKYCADYFRWIKVVVATNEYSAGGKELAVYEADLNPVGSKVVGSERVYPENGPATFERLESDLLLYSDKRGVSDVINVDTSGESFFSNQDPPSNIATVLLRRARPAGKFLPYREFIKIYDQFRIWVPNLNQLMLPNFEEPTHDGVPGGHYMGGLNAYKKLVGPLEAKEEQEQEPPSKDKELKEPSEPIFKPVDQSGKSEEGVEMKRYSNEEKTLKMARNVTLRFIKESQVTNVYETGAANKNKEVNLDEQVQESRKKEKAFKELSKAYGDMAETVDKLNK